MIANSVRPGLRRLSASLAAMIAVAAVMAFASQAAAQQPREMIETRTLDNGLEVIVISDPTLPIVTVEVAVKNGAFTEPPELNGLSHLYEHMFFKGNAVIPNQEAYLERMRELGIVFNGTTSAERVNYFFTLPSTNLEPGLQFMYDAITSPTFDEDEFAREKQVVIGEIDRAESNPHYWIRRAIGERLWYEHPSRKDPLGDRESVLAATVEQMRTMKERYYVPNNSTLMIAGDVEPQVAFELAEEVYGSWERGPDPFEEWEIPEHPPLKEDAFVVVEEDVKVPYVQFSWHGPSVDEDPQATHAADVLSFILSQPTSRFQKQLVNSGLTLSAGTSYYTQRHTGPINVSAQVTPDKLREAIRALLIEVQRLQDPEYYTDEQLQSAKTILAVRDTYDREKTSSFARTVTFWWASAGLDYYFDYVADLEAVTRDDIARYVSDYIIGKPYVAGVLLSEQDRAKIGLSEEAFAEIVREVEQEIADDQQVDGEAADTEEGNEN